MKQLLSLATIVALVLVCTASVDAATSAGMVVTASGDVMVRRGDTVPVTASFQLLIGDTLVLAIGSRCEIRTADGTDALEGPLQRIFQETTAGKQGGIGGWITTQLNHWMGKPRPGDFRSRGLGDAADDDATFTRIQLVSPSRAGVFPHSSVRPHGAVIEWEPVSGVDEYEVVIATEASQITHVVEHVTQVKTELSPGGRYACMVMARGSREPAPQSDWCEFDVISNDDEKSLNAALEGKSDLDAGTILMFVGLYQEAIERFTRVIDAEVDVASALRWRSLAYESIGLTDQARKDLTMATGGDQ
jgi:hypothetical protein